MKVIAFSPAHITGFFEIFYTEDEMATGSRGAGFSISLGSYAELWSSGNMSMEGNIGKGEITREALKLLGVDNVKVKIKNELPLSQGFGMSASSTLASTLAACHLLSLEPENALRATHIAEVKMGGGLGDAIAAFHGGMEARISPGMKGKIEVMECRAKILVAVVGEPIETKKIIKNEKMMERIKIALLYICMMIVFSIIFPIILILYIQERPWKRQKMSEEERRRLEEKFRLGYISII